MNLFKLLDNKYRELLAARDEEERLNSSEFQRGQVNGATQVIVWITEGAVEPLRAFFSDEQIESARLTPNQDKPLTPFHTATITFNDNSSLTVTVSGDPDKAESREYYWQKIRPVLTPVIGQYLPPKPPGGTTNEN